MQQLEICITQIKVAQHYSTLSKERQEMQCYANDYSEQANAVCINNFFLIHNSLPISLVHTYTYIYLYRVCAASTKYFLVNI